ncbi:MAG: leucine dehydrogenase, partial [Phycisphaerae bacterium]|nr:leucine dehydrogenase [Phycisphaerae bacterium]
AAACSPDNILSTECDILCPAALGGVINNKTIGTLRCKVIAGAANNPLSEDRLAEELTRRNILYIPDYAINAGGLIHVGSEYLGLPKEEALRKAAGIGDTIRKVLQIADMEKITTLAAADRMAEARIAKARNNSHVKV